MSLGQVLCNIQILWDLRKGNFHEPVLMTSQGFHIDSLEVLHELVVGDETVVQAADQVDKVIDTTGAGDAWCAGFLFGWANDWPLEKCAQLGTHCATAVIQQVGARIEPGIIDGFE